MLIDLTSNKIISSAVLYKDYRSLNGNYPKEEVCNLMEIKALHMMSNELLDNRITTFISDGDVKIKNFIENLQRNGPLVIRKDPGHVFLCIMRTFKTLNTRFHNIFKPILNNFSKFVKTCVNEIEDPILRVKAYFNVSNHYSGIHDPNLCPPSIDSPSIQYFDSTNQKSREVFEEFLKKHQIIFVIYNKE